MNVFLTPDLRPFFAGTYFPPEDSYGRPGFARVLTAVEEAYQNRSDEVNASAEQVMAILRQLSRPAGGSAAIRIDHPFVREMIDRAAADFDDGERRIRRRAEVSTANIAGTDPDLSAQTIPMRS